MTGSSVLPVALYKGKLYFLFGKENDKEDSAKGFSDFGGGIEKGETVTETAIREGAEEITGFLGNPSQLKSLIRKNGGMMRICIPDYYTHVFPLQYDAALPNYYNQNHQFLWNRMDKDLLNRTKLFEKIEIQWFTVNQMKYRIKEFRGFYQIMVKKLIESAPEIKRFLQKCKCKCCSLRATCRKRKRGQSRKRVIRSQSCKPIYNREKSHSKTYRTRKRKH
jgi:8-oxo-dGTP pyrophosphatase MutT (NUDIX family)